MPMPSVSPTGVTAIEAIVGAVTVSVVLVVTPASPADIFVVPAAILLTIPAAFTVATALDCELQDTTLVKSELLPSL